MPETGSLSAVNQQMESGFTVSLVCLGILANGPPIHAYQRPFKAEIKAKNYGNG